ncbi:FAD-binding domain-containing protein [Terracoccus luteus]|uniref:Deoxyribodipyrimidine photo-lyase n=1 Tax=Terracoccus luteus TaxID=53356 RepID=A0A839PUT4_9MICO|nr:FAD-binding domain-containing protein [Terracoccus luteus]MBB2988008.1 deoxyribodipyrimidine photo-lyase [Terracoccus luteus]MCP2173659.1 deoxyribodipyrimidine photo-lyase [Terracoccus luteus]
MSDQSRLPTPTEGDEVAWVQRHLGHLTLEDAVAASPAFRGGQGAADVALATFDVTGYARRRSEVLPERSRGASRLSPYVRHGLIDLPTLWAHVADGPPRDRDKYRDELLWQEYARHLHSRVGEGMRRPLRHEPPRRDQVGEWGWDRSMACVDLTVGELETDGWLVNQTRMWLASQWTVRAGHDWRDGAKHFERHLLDGSAAANLLGWQWTVGTGTGKPYGFSQWQVRKRAPGLCERCPLVDACPISGWPDSSGGPSVPDPTGLLRSDPDPGVTAGPAEVEPLTTGTRPDAVWLTWESLGDGDPALEAHPDLPAVLVFDERLLARRRLSGKRLVFVAETLADLATRRDVEVHLGRPAEVLRDRPVASTAAPVPGWRRLTAGLDVERHPWPWLVRPRSGPVSSFTAWRRSSGAPATGAARGGPRRSGGRSGGAGGRAGRR